MLEISRRRIFDEQDGEVCAGADEGGEMNPDWEKCEHEWEESPFDSQFANEYVTELICKKCGCPGEIDSRNGNKVYWPAT